MKKYSFLFLTLLLGTLLASQKVYPSIEEEIADWKKKRDEAQSIIPKAEEELKKVESDRTETQREIGQVDQDIQKAKENKNGHEGSKAMLALSGLEKDGIEANTKVESVGGVSLGYAKDSLNSAADSLDRIKGQLRRMGFKDQDIQKIINEVGIDPERMADKIRDVADTVKPQMNMNDLSIYENMLSLRLKEVRADEEKIKNTVAKERAEVARYDADIAKARRDWEDADRSRRIHDMKADAYMELCRREWWHCAWAVPAAGGERAMAMADQANMNRINTWIGILNAGRAFPAGVVAYTDTVKAGGFTFARQLLEKQLGDLKETKRNLQAKLDAEFAKVDAETKRQRDELDAKIKAEERKIAELGVKRTSLSGKLGELDTKKFVREKDLNRFKSEVTLANNEIAKLEQKQKALEEEARKQEEERQRRLVEEEAKRKKQDEETKKRLLELLGVEGGGQNISERPALTPPPASEPPRFEFGQKVSARPALAQNPGRPGGEIVLADRRPFTRSGNVPMAVLAPPSSEEGVLTTFGEAFKSIQNRFAKKPEAETDLQQKIGLSKKETQDGIRWFNDMQKKIQKAQISQPASQKKPVASRPVVQARQQVRVAPKIRAAVESEATIPFARTAPPRRQEESGGWGQLLGALQALSGEQTQSSQPGYYSEQSEPGDVFEQETYSYVEPEPAEEEAIDTSSWQSPESDNSWQAPQREIPELQSDNSWQSPQSDESWQGYEEG